MGLLSHVSVEKNERSFIVWYSILEASLVAQTVKNLPKLQAIWVQSLDQEDSLEKGMNSSILAWRIPWREEPGQSTVHGAIKSWTQLSH